VDKANRINHARPRKGAVIQLSVVVGINVIIDSAGKAGEAGEDEAPTAQF